MKKHILLAILFIGSINVHACDICGCGTGNGYIGILPDFHKHIAGIRYRHNSMFTHIGVGGEHTYLTTKESYRIIEAWGGWNISNKFRLMASLPYNFNEKNNQETISRKNGIGDISLSGYYQLVNKRQSIGNSLLVQSLWAGAGVKLPTGSYNPEDKGTSTNNANLFQLGTGSTDFTVGFMYDVRLQDVGINLSSNYKMNTENSDQYQYGNKFNLNTQAYYKFRTKNNLMIAPNAGIQYEKSATDSDDGFEVTASGGNLLLGTIGVELAFGKMALGANYQTPFSQNLAKGIIKANNRMMLHAAFAL